MESLTKTQLAIEGGKPFRTVNFPKWPFVGERERELAMEVVNSQNWWRMSGKKVDEFEQKFARAHAVKHCIGVTNGTHAIELVLSALNIAAGDEVLVPAFTFISTATAVLYCNATPVPVDCDPGSFCMDPESLEKYITPRTKAIIPVHMAGHVCDMDAIVAIAEKHGLEIIEDAAHAHGAEWKGKKIGSFGIAATFSFQNGKIMTCGEGGAILTNDDALFEKMFLIHGVGRPKYDREYKHIELGSNYRMNEFQAAILLAQLERLDEQNQLRQKHAKLLTGYLGEIEGIVPQGIDPRVTVNPSYMYMFYYNPDCFDGLSRNEFVDVLNAEGIPAYRAYPLVHTVQFFREGNFRRSIEMDYTSFHLPHAERIAAEVVWLPHFVLLGNTEDLKDIYGAIKKIKETYAGQSCSI
jgi:3-amino-5-hydroxybenzoate synthase